MKEATNPVEERLAAWVLARLARPPLRTRLEVLEQAGSCAGALRRLGVGWPGDGRRRAERFLRRCEQEGYRLLVLGEPEYPPLLARIDDPPICLTVRGSILKEDALGLAIVGSRRATAYGRETSRRLARELGAAGLTIVSGLARGIDAAAHEGALEGGGRTLAVLGSGLDNLYPREHRRLADRVASRGAVLSELDLDEPPLAQNFPRRNRIITGLTVGTLVVEAAEKSGSLVSARLALEQNREVFAVPGPVSSPTSEGVHGLLRDGARLVTRAADVLDELHVEIRGGLAAKRATAPSTSRSEGREPFELDELDDDERSLYTTLLATHDVMDLDSLLERISLPVERALAALSRLEVAGRLVALPGGLYRVARR